MNRRMFIQSFNADGAGSGGSPGAGGGAGGAGAGAPPPFIETLPQELRAEPSLKTVPDVATLAKNYVNAQKLIGTKRMPVPDANWTEQQWSELYNMLGRPETPDKYPVPEIKLEEGLQFDEKKMETVKQHFHKLGLSDKQAKGVLEYYLNSLNESAKSERTNTDAAVQAAENELKQTWGDKYNANLELAKGVIRKFGDEKLLNQLAGSGMANNSQLIQLLSKLGGMMSEDKSKGGMGADLGLTDATRATQEIDSLKTDVAFMRALTTQRDPGHKAAVDRWARLHKLAFPGTVQAA